MMTGATTSHSTGAPVERPDCYCRGFKGSQGVTKDGRGSKGSQGVTKDGRGFKG